MKVMKEHTWFDENVKKTFWESWMHEDVRVISFEKEPEKNGFIVSKADAIALAKEFDLIVYEKDANL